MSAERRRLLITVIAAVAATVAAVVLIGQAAHFADLLTHLRAARPAWLLLCAAGEALAYAGFIASYQAMAELDGGPRLAFTTVARVVGLSFGAFSVATAIGGLSVDFWALREAGESPTLASARVIALETMRWAVLSLATCVAAIAVLIGSTGDHVPRAVPVVWLIITPLCFAGGLWISAPARRSRFTNSSGARWRVALGVAVGALVLIRSLMRAPVRLAGRAVGGAALFWAGEVLCAWAALRCFGVTLAFAPLLLGYTTGYVSMGLPLPAGGAGTVDAAVTGGFVLAGASLSSALLGAIVFRVFSFWLPVVGAVLSLATLRGLRARLHAVAERRAARLSSVSALAPDPATPHPGHR
jgi:putative heme transporter